ncbi:hypothetical protein ACOMHN_001104 [Nucella lapillus]
MWCSSIDADEACSWLDSSSSSGVTVISTYCSEENWAVRNGNEDDNSNSYDDDDPPAYSPYPAGPPPYSTCDDPPPPYSLYDHGPSSGCDIKQSAYSCPPVGLPAYSPRDEPPPPYSLNDQGPSSGSDNDPPLDQCPPPHSLGNPGPYIGISIGDREESEILVPEPEPDLAPLYMITAALPEASEVQPAWMYQVTSEIDQGNGETLVIESDVFGYTMPPPSRDEVLENYVSQILCSPGEEGGNCGGGDEDALPPPPPPPTHVAEDYVVDQSYFPPPPSEQELANMLSGIGI